MLHASSSHRLAHVQLARAAEALQTKVNQFIGLAAMAEVEVPDSLYETSAELLDLRDKVRAATGHGAEQSEHLQEVTICGD